MALLSHFVLLKIVNCLSINYILYIWQIVRLDYIVTESKTVLRTCVRAMESTNYINYQALSSTRVQQGHYSLRPLGLQNL